MTGRRLLDELLRMCEPGVEGESFYRLASRVVAGDEVAFRERAVLDNHAAIVEGSGDKSTLISMIDSPRIRSVGGFHPYVERTTVAWGMPLAAVNNFLVLRSPGGCPWP